MSAVHGGNPLAANEELPPQDRPHPLRELLGRYVAVFKAAWKARDQLAGPKRLADEAAFLPAALSLQDTPVHPAPRRAALALCAFFFIALVWSILGKIDIVAVANGRIVVSESTKTLQPLEAGVIKRVLVKDGDSVKAGQVLVELDGTEARADQASVQEQLTASTSEQLRTQALMTALQSGKPPVLMASDSPLNAEPAWSAGSLLRAQAQAQLSAEYQDVLAKLSKLAAEQARKQAEAETVKESIAKLQATLPLAQQREADFKRLTEQGFMANHAGQDRTRERIELERDLATQQAKLKESQAGLLETVNSRAAFLAETQRSLSERHADASLKREQLMQERSKTQQRTRLTQLTAPVDGSVQQVAVHTEGGVVTPAQVLMVIVPKDALVTAEVTVDNKDIGFVNAGQPVTVKLETFPFTRYGTIDAVVKSVTADAVNDEKRGAIFPAILTLKQNSIDVDGKRIHLSPGMNVAAEIKTGQRRVIDYLFSPVKAKLNESLGER